MNSKIKYKNVSLKESVLDVRVSLHDGFDFQQLADLVEKYQEDFPQKQVQTQFETGFKVEEGQPSVSNTLYKKNGFILKNKKGDRALQLRLDGFTFSKLHPYNGWDKFTGEAYGLLNEYLDAIKPLNITRIALRFINEIKIPLPIESLENYFNTFPIIPNKLTILPNKFLFQFSFEDSNAKDISAIVTQAVKQKTKEFLPYIFDIDVFKEKAISSDIAKIKKEFISLRKFKNFIFEESLKEKAKDLIR